MHDVTDPVLAAIGARCLAGCLSPDELAGLSAAMEQGSAQPAQVITRRSDQLELGVDGEIRRTREVVVSDPWAGVAARAFDAVAVLLEPRFGPVRRREAVSFLRYGAGDHFRFHRDALSDTGSDALPDTSSDDVPRTGAPHLADPRVRRARQRQVTCVLSVNGMPRGPEGPYDGGALRLMADSGPFSDFAFAATLAAGTVIAFPSTMLHEVTEVTRGIRLSAVAWLS